MPDALLQNDTHFQSVYSLNNAPEILFHRIKDCQEIQILGDNPYTPKQLLNNATQLLLGCGLYQHNFEEWDRKIPANKICINLKPFIQEAYQRRLNAMANMAGQHRYMQNAFAALGDNSNDDDDVNNNVATITTHLAALTMQSQLTAASTVATTASVTTAINQLASNQQAMMQMMAYANTARDQVRTHTRKAPPLVPTTHFNIPAIGYFQQGGQGRGGIRRGGGRGGQETAPGRSGCRNRMPYVDTGATQIFFRGGIGEGIPPFVPVPGPAGYARNATLAYSNIIKR